MCVRGGKPMSEETPQTEINARGDDPIAKPHREQDEEGFGNEELPDERRVVAETDEEGSFGDTELPDGRRVAAETDEEGSFGDTEPPEERA
jgi:hypothetical protein